jgi:murein DD-endopeptidase MepM/ murein hydrolase activator NlpD
MSKLPYVLFSIVLTSPIYLPINIPDRKDISQIHLTAIGQFGIMRKARPNVPAHYHTGIDIKRPGSNYDAEHILPIAKGVIISKRTDGPYANLMIEHEINGTKFWSVYEHVAGISVRTGETVLPETPIARFMTKAELNQYGWQFDHFHLEILKVKPMQLKPSKSYPERFYNSYSLVCYTKKDLERYFYNPLDFLKNMPL